MFRTDSEKQAFVAGLLYGSQVFDLPREFGVTIEHGDVAQFTCMVVRALDMADGNVEDTRVAHIITNDMKEWIQELKPAVDMFYAILQMTKEVKH